MITWTWTFLSWSLLMISHDLYMLTEDDTPNAINVIGSSYQPELFIKYADTKYYLHDMSSLSRFFSKSRSILSFMSMNSLSVGIFYLSGEPISLHLLRCDPIAVEDHSFMGRRLAYTATSTRE